MIEHSDIVLTCTTLDSKEIRWERLDEKVLNETPYTISGRAAMSTLTIRDVQMLNEGMYTCMVGEKSTDFTLVVVEVTGMIKINFIFHNIYFSLPPFSLPLIPSQPQVPLREQL